MNNQTLFQRWQSGDAQAFEELYTAHAPTIYRLGRAMLRDSELAEDVVQETFLRAYKARKRYNPEKAGVGTWLYQIALNYCRSYLRKKRFLLIPLPNDNPDLPSLPDKQPTPEANFLKTEYHKTLWAAVQNLNPQLKEVVTLHYYLEIPAVEIALILNCPEGTIYSRLYHARKKLTAFLSAQELEAADIIESQNAS